MEFLRDLFVRSYKDMTNSKKAIYSFIALIVLSAISFTLFSITSRKVQASGTISGTVYVDYNMNGIRDTVVSSSNQTVDGGIGSVTVTIYDSAGASKTTTTATNGAYSLDTSAAPALAAGPYRLEFTNLPAGYFPSAVGTNNASTVKFVANGTSTDNDLGVILPNNYCQPNPLMTTSVYNIGPSASDTLVKFPYNYSEELDGRLDSIDPTSWTTPPSRTALLNPAGIADADSLGAVFGITYDCRNSKLYSAAYLKRGANFGRLSDSTGAIYVTNNPTESSPTTSLYVDLNSIFGAETAGANPHPIDTTDFSTDSATPILVGKRALGGLKISADGTKIYAVNLNDRRLYVIPTSGTLNSTTITRFDIPTTGLNTSGGICNSADVRPFAVGRDNSGQIYVGGVCSAESETTDTKVHAYIWRFNGAAFVLVADNTLTFSRFASGTNNATWLRWDDTATGVLFRPSPMLTDIEFDGNNMLLGFRDRYGDMTVLPDFNRGYGDIMRVCNVAGTFIFESNGTCGSVTSTDPGTNNNSGNGGREFYTDLNGDGREEGGWGGLTQVPGYNHVITTMYDPVSYDSSGTRVSNFYTGGVQRYNNTTGVMTGAYDVYLADNSTTGNFGKANGSGDTEALCDSAPLQVGNRVWSDTNQNGIQDSSESPLTGVTVQLWEDTDDNGSFDTQIGTTTTDSNGNYIFGGVNNTNLGTYSCGTTNGSVDVRVNASSDDAEQASTGGTVTLNSTDLDFFGDNNGGGTAYSNVGVRFNSLNIPQGATITSAYIEFTANNSDTVSAGNPTITIQGENVDNAATFQTTANNISSRTWLSGQDVTWNPGAWTNASTTNTSTPSLTNIVQAIVNRGGWASGNSMAFRFTGTSTTSLYREAESFDGNNAAAPRLVVQYTVPATCNYQINRNTAYQVRIPSSNFGSGQPLFGFSISPADNDGTANGDSRDSDGSLSSGNVVANFISGDAGQNNHTYDFGFYLAPTAANVSVGGRVNSASGRALSGVLVYLIDQNGNQRQTMSNSFGYYRFDEIEVGQTVTVSVFSKRYTFNQPSQVLTLKDNALEVNFYGDGR